MRFLDRSLWIPSLALCACFTLLGCKSETETPVQVPVVEQPAAAANTEAAGSETADSETVAEAPAEGEWVTIFDGTSLDGWEANERPESWKIEDGILKGSGPPSHLFYKKQKYSDLEFQLEVKLSKGSNSGMYFRTAFGPRFPDGYEAQLNNSHTDPIRTGSLYKFAKVEEQLIEDDTWWTQRVIAKGNHIQIFVNDKKVVDFTDEKNTYTDGYVALQQHDPGSHPEFRNIKVRELK